MLKNNLPWQRQQQQAAVKSEATSAASTKRMQNPPAQNLIMANHYSSTIQRCGQWNKWVLIGKAIKYSIWRL